MLKLINIAFALSYFVLSVGMQVHIHQCSHDESVCATEDGCCSHISSNEAKGCCSHSEFNIQIDDEHLVPEAAKTLFVFNALVQSHPEFRTSTEFNSLDKTVVNTRGSPPSYPPLHILLERSTTYG